MYIASVLAVVGAVWFYRSQRRPLPVAATEASAGAGPPGDDGPADDQEPGNPPGGASAGDGPRESRDSQQAASEP
jgi:hypothetical protein